ILSYQLDTLTIYILPMSTEPNQLHTLSLHDALPISSASGESASSTRSAQTFPPTSSRYVLIASQSMLGLAISSTDGSTWRMALLVQGAVVLVQSAVVQRWSVVPNPTFDRRGCE